MSLSAEMPFPLFTKSSALNAYDEALQSGTHKGIGEGLAFHVWDLYRDSNPDSDLDLPKFREFLNEF